MQVQILLTGKIAMLASKWNLAVPQDLNFWQHQLIVEPCCQCRIELNLNQHISFEILNNGLTFQIIKCCIDQNQNYCMANGDYCNNKGQELPIIGLLRF